MPGPDFDSNPKWQQDLLKKHMPITKRQRTKQEKKYPVKKTRTEDYARVIKELTESRQGTDFEGYPFDVKPKKNPFLPDLDENDPNNMERIFDTPTPPEPQPESEPTGDSPWREIKQKEEPDD